MISCNKDGSKGKSKGLLLSNIMGGVLCKKQMGGGGGGGGASQNKDAFFPDGITIILSLTWECPYLGKNGLYIEMGPRYLGFNKLYPQNTTYRNIPYIYPTVNTAR